MSEAVLLFLYKTIKIVNFRQPIIADGNFRQLGWPTEVTTSRLIFVS
jgi:hypothetical protein